MTSGSGNGRPSESVWDYPRPPRLETSSLRVRVELEGAVVAESRTTSRVLETSHPPVFYFPPEDVAPGALRPAGRRTFCEWKGEASYFDVIVPGRTEAAAAWAYANPTGRFEAIRGYVAFYPSRMDECSVDGEIVLSQDGDFYGGWITSELRGPFKGGPGSGGW